MQTVIKVILAITNLTYNYLKQNAGVVLRTKDFKIVRTLN